MLALKQCRLCADADMTVDLIREELTQVYDVERLLSRIAYKAIHAKDCLALRDSLSHVPAITSCA